MEGGLGTLQKVDVLLGYLATAKSKPLRTAVLTGLYTQGRSLHDVAANVDEFAKVEVERDDSARDGRMGAMVAGVRALLLKYDQQQQHPVAEEAAESGGGGADEAAAGPSAMLPPPPPL